MYSNKWNVSSVLRRWSKDKIVNKDSKRYDPFGLFEELQNEIYEELKNDIFELLQDNILSELQEDRFKGIKAEKIGVKSDTQEKGKDTPYPGIIPGHKVRVFR